MIRRPPISTQQVSSAASDVYKRQVFESLEKMKPLVQASKDTEFMIRSEDILTIADPTQEVIDKYLKLTS